MADRDRRLSSGLKNAAACQAFAWSFAGLVVFMVTFLPNSWLNYQVLLILPVMLILHYRTPGTCRLSTDIFLVALLLLWSLSFLDSAQERVNHFLPENLMPSCLREISGNIPGLTHWSRWGRCLASLALLAICMANSRPTTSATVH